MPTFDNIKTVASFWLSLSKLDLQTFIYTPKVDYKKLKKQGNVELDNKNINVRRNYIIFIKHFLNGLSNIALSLIKRVLSSIITNNYNKAIQLCESAFAQKYP